MMLGALQALVFDGTQATPELQPRHRRSRCDVLVSAPPGENGDPVLARIRRRLGAGASTCARSSISRPSASMATAAAQWVDEATPPHPDRRAAARGLRPSAPGSRSASEMAPASPCCVSPAFTGRVRTRWNRSRAAKRAASSSPDRFSTASMSPTSRRRSMPRLRARASGIFNVADDEPSPPGDPIVFAAQLAGHRAAAGNSVCASGARRCRRWH